MAKSTDDETIDIMTAESIAEVCEMLAETSDDTSSRGGWGSCQSKFADGQCDSECDDERNHFDGFDCAIDDTSPPAADAGGWDGDAECNEDTRPRANTHQAASRRPQCSQVYADGTCDSDCDSAACLWDGGDCIGTALRFIIFNLLMPPLIVVSLLFKNGFYMQFDIYLCAVLE